jgi:hypothetical protein
VASADRRRRESGISFGEAADRLRRFEYLDVMPSKTVAHNAGADDEGTET